MVNKLKWRESDATGSVSSEHAGPLKNRDRQSLLWNYQNTINQGSV